MPACNGTNIELHDASRQPVLLAELERFVWISYGRISFRADFLRGGQSVEPVADGIACVRYHSALRSRSRSPGSSSESLGPVLSERAETIGKGKLFLGFTFQRIGFDSMDGTDLKNLPLVFRVCVVPCSASNLSP